jgi:hypothetical protein
MLRNQWYNNKKYCNITDCVAFNEKANKELDEKRKFLYFDLN